MAPKKSKNAKKKSNGKNSEAISPANGLLSEKSDSQFTFSTTNGSSGTFKSSDKKEEVTTTIETPSASATSSASSSSTAASANSRSQGEADAIARAAAFKEEGNEAFKAQQFEKAIELYTLAIQLHPEPTYLTNRAASYIALKRFGPALTDCQQAAALQADNPSPKTLLRLARCQLAIGSPTPALSTIRLVLSLDPKNAAAKQLQTKVLELEAHLRNVESERSRNNWNMARIALDRCYQAVEGEDGDVPTEWRCWRVEFELAKGNWDAASLSANDAVRLDANSADALALRGLYFFLTAKLPNALQHCVSALRLDPDNQRAKDLRVRVKAVERLKDEGNTLFKQSQWNEAIDKYGEALEVVGSKEEEGKGGQMRATLLSNRATSFLKLGKYDEALLDTDVSLSLHPSSVKALRARARINLHMERYDAAVHDFKEAIDQAEMEGSAADVRALRDELRKAEVALKRSTTKDYYKILGLSKDCEDTDIKKAYRRESLKHHPDKGGDEEKFKLVAEAHAVLSDPQRKQRYDMGMDEDGSSSSGMGGMGGNPFGMHMDPSELHNIFAAFGGSRFGGFGPQHYHFE